MRATLQTLVLVVAGALSGHTAQAQSDPPKKAEKLPKLEVSIDKAKVDLEKHRLEVKLNRTAQAVKIKVWGESGSVLADEEHDFEGKPAGTPLVVSWSPSSDEPVAKIHVFGYDSEGYYKGVAIVPWSLTIPHEEVTFETDSATIRSSEEPKLEASYKLIADALVKHKDLGPITLFIAGHTDTVGSDQHNLELSRRRARSIATWFRKRGLKIPIAFEGFGEAALAVKTKDDVDEPRNRRVDYVLSVEEPAFKKSRKRPAWKRL